MDTTPRTAPDVISLSGSTPEARVAKLLWMSGRFTTTPPSATSDATIAQGLAGFGGATDAEAIARVRGLLAEDAPIPAPAALVALAVEQVTAIPDPKQRTKALTDLDHALHGDRGAVRAVRAARTATLRERLESGESRADLARELGVSAARVAQLVGGNVSVTAGRKRARGRATAERTSVRDDLARATAALRAQVVAERAADRARRGAGYLARIDAGEASPRTIAAELTAAGEPTSWQAVSVLVREARKAREADRGARSRFAGDFDEGIIVTPAHQVAE